MVPRNVTANGWEDRVDGPLDENEISRLYRKRRAKGSQSSPATDGQIPREIRHGLLERHGWG